MKKYVLIFLFLILSLSLSCEKIPENDIAGVGELEMQKITNLSGIPNDYGPLFSVTANGAHPGWAQLWFLDDDGIIRMVRVNFHEYRVSEKIIVIPRN